MKRNERNLIRISAKLESNHAFLFLIEQFCPIEKSSTPNWNSPLVGLLPHTKPYTHTEPTDLLEEDKQSPWQRNIYMLTIVRI
jgi:hypothetical protein